jgi:hypothetical protein
MTLKHFLLGVVVHFLRKLLKVTKLVNEKSLDIFDLLDCWNTWKNMNMPDTCAQNYLERFNLLDVCIYFDCMVFPLLLGIVLTVLSCLDCLELSRLLGVVWTAWSCLDCLELS